MSVHRFPGGQPPRRPSAHLQPELDPDDLFADVDGVLEQFEDYGETAAETNAETREADRAITRLTRLGGDAQVHKRLAEQDFTGPEYELFRAELAAYALPVLRSFIRRKVIYQMCRDAQRPVDATDKVREHLAHNADDRLELACEAVARGLHLFERDALRGGRWSPERGASLKTFFVGACVRSFTDAFKDWVTEHDHPDTRALALADDDDRYRALDDPADYVEGLAQVKELLDGMKPAIRDTAARIALFDETFEEAGQACDLSARAVEGYLYRIRTEAKRREQKRGGT
ncbi:hypothetical protein [Amycolatopsis sp. NPDC004625]|uniref:hypothetical protein n=1 Tax=Amycolatopsis sp. NPDC004625 TaxID=3154670 RepID=UPI0033A9375B